MIGFVIAMEEEIKPYINKYNWIETKNHGSSRKYYTGKFLERDIMAVVSGYGKSNCSASTANLIHKGCKFIVNLGTCGAIHHKSKFGTVMQPNRFFDGDIDLNALGFDTKDPANVNSQIYETNIDCYSFSRFVDDAVLNEPALVDMEVYSCVAVCKELSTPYAVFKIISDNADENAYDNFSTLVNTVMSDSINIIEHKLNDILKEHF